MTSHPPLRLFAVSNYETCGQSDGPNEKLALLSSEEYTDVLDASLELYSFSGDYKSPEYAETLATALKHFPQNTTFLSRFGDFMKYLGHHDLAEKAYSKIVALDPHDANALFNLGLHHLMHDKLYDALECANMLLSLPDLPARTLSNGLGVRASARYRSQDYEGALEDLTKRLALEDIPDKARISALTTRGKIYSRYKDYEAVHRDMDALLQLSSLSLKDKEVAYGQKTKAYINQALSDPKNRGMFLQKARIACTSLPNSQSHVLLYEEAKIDFYEGNPGEARHKVRRLLAAGHDRMMFKVLYLVLAPDDDALAEQFQNLMDPVEYSQAKKLAEQWRREGREPEPPEPMGRYSQTSIFDGRLATYIPIDRTAGKVSALDFG